MKNLMNRFFQILIVCLVFTFSMSCSSQQNDANQEQHDDMMNDNPGEMREGDDHMHEDGQSGQHMMNDSTSKEMNEEMDQ